MSKAAAAVAAGLCDVAVVGGGTAGPRMEGMIGKPSEFHTPYGAYTVPLFANVAQRHMFEYGTTPEQLATVAATIRNHGSANPAAVMYGKGPYTASDVLASRMVATPLHLLDVCLVAQGGAAIVITTAERARDLRHPPIGILGASSEMRQGQWSGLARYEDVQHVGADAVKLEHGSADDPEDRRIRHTAAWPGRRPATRRIGSRARDQLRLGGAALRSRPAGEAVSTTEVGAAVVQDWPQPFVHGLYWTAETDLMRFVSMGFTESLFMDPAGAQAAGYRGRLVPGALTFSLAEGLLMQTNVIHGTGIAFLGTTMTVSAPVFVGDTIQVAWTVMEARPTSKGNRGIVTTRNLVRRQDGQIVMEYSPTRMIAGPPQGKPQSNGSRS